MLFKIITNWLLIVFLILKNKYVIKKDSKLIGNNKFITFVQTKNTTIYRVTFLGLNFLQIECTRIVKLLSMCVPM